MRKNYYLPAILWSLLLTHAGISYAQATDWQWAKAAGGDNFDAAMSLSTDPTGNLIVAGYFKSTSITFGSETLTNTSSYEHMYLTKYDASGQVLWAKSFGGKAQVIPKSVTTDADGNILVSGYFRYDTVAFGSTLLPNNGFRDMFLAKFDADGQVLWARSAGSGSWDDGLCVHVDIGGNILVSGYFNGPTIKFGAITLTNSFPGSNISDIFLVKYDSDGHELWAISGGGISGDSGIAVSSDADGNIILAGDFLSNSITLDNIVLTNTGINYDMFVAKFDANGQILWAKTASGHGDENPRAVAIDASGNFYVVGDFSLFNVTFDATTLNLAGEDDLFLVKYNAQGNVLWAKSAGGNLDEFASSLSLDPSGNIVIAGYYKSPSVSIGSTSLTNAGAEDAFLAKYDPSGYVLWAKNLSGTKRDQANDIHVDKTGSIYMAGSFASPELSFGATTLSNSGLDDSFITKLDWTTAVSALNEEDWAQVYPNPASDQLYYELSPEAYNARLEVYDMLGKRILWQKINTPIGYLDLTGLTNGVYVITLKADYSSFWTGKLTIQK